MDDVCPPMDGNACFFGLWFNVVGLVHFGWVGFIFFVGHQHFKAGLSFDCANLKETKGKFKKRNGTRQFNFCCVRMGGGLRNLKNRVVAISLYNNPEQYFFFSLIFPLNFFVWNEIVQGSHRILQIRLFIYFLRKIYRYQVHVSTQTQVARSSLFYFLISLF